MRRLLVSLLVACLLGASAVSVVAQEPPPPPWFGSQRVDMPEHHFAVTVPEGWVAFDPAAEIGSQNETVEAVLGPDLFGEDPQFVLDMAFATKAAKDTGAQLAVIDTATSDRCLMSAYPWSESPADVASVLYGQLGADPEAENVSFRLSILDIPAGRLAFVLQYAEQGRIATTEDWVDKRFSKSWYLLGGPGRYLLIRCRTYGMRPDDDWLSLVETVEFLPMVE